MSVVDPIKVVITNFPWSEVGLFWGDTHNYHTCNAHHTATQDHVVEVPNNKNDPSSGTRFIPFKRILYIERSDFREVHYRD